MQTDGLSKKAKLKQFLKNASWLKRGILFILSLVFMFLLCWLLSETAFKNSGAIPTPSVAWQEFLIICKEGSMWLAIGNTLKKAIAAFVFSLLFGFLLAVLANLSKTFKQFIEPIISVLRAAPTLGVTFILFMWLNGEMTAIVVGFLIIFPMMYSNLYAAIENTDKRLIKMASVYEVSKIRQVFGVYLPAILPYIFSASLAGFGMGIKVIVAAEIITIPTRTTLGSFMFHANNSFNYPALFIWVLVTIAVSLVCELLIKALMYAVMPWKRKRRKADD